MNRIIRDTSRLLPVGISCLALACSSAPGEDGTESSSSSPSPAGGAVEPAAAAPVEGVASSASGDSVANAKLVWSEKLSETHLVDFYQQESSGTPLIVEAVYEGTDRLITPALAKKGFAAVYAAIKPQASLPEPLAAADSTVANPSSAPASDAALPHTSTGKVVLAAEPASGVRVAAADGDSVQALTASEISAWKQSTCHLTGHVFYDSGRGQWVDYNDQTCVTGFTWATTGNIGGFTSTVSAYSAAAELGSEATVAASFVFKAYTCWASGLFGLGQTCGWNNLITQSVQPGWHWTWMNGNNGTPSDFNASISSPSGKNGNATVGVWDEQVIDYPP